MSNKVTPQALALKKHAGEKIVALTAYDYSMARLMDDCGIDLVLVGDSVGMVALGYENTLPVSMEEMLHHTRAVSRAVKRALVVADMPFLSYGVSDEATVKNAGRFIQEGFAQGVKLEGGREMAAAVRKLVDLGVPVLGHIGMMPSHILSESGYRVMGKSAAAQRDLMDDAQALQDAGVFGIVLECVKSDVAATITETLAIPTIGIGAGAACDGQILVSYDLLGIYEAVKPKFAKRYAQLASEMRKAFEAYKADVEQGSFPGKEYTY